MQELLPKFEYYLDESDPDVVILRRRDGTFVAALSACGATREGIVEAAKEDVCPEAWTERTSRSATLDASVLPCLVVMRVLHS